MKMSRTFVLVIFFCGFVDYICNLQIIPERAEVYYTNSSYVRDVTVNIRKQTRRGQYVANIEGTSLHPWGNNISFHAILYEYLHNEYKRTFVEFHFKLCDMINSDPYIGRALNNAGLTSCPVSPGKYILGNISIPADDFPYLWPFERARANGLVMHACSGDVIVNASIYITFKQKLKTKSLI